MLNRVVVTGLGVVSPIGTGKEPYAKSLFSGSSGVGRVTQFDASQYTTGIAAEVKDFSPDKMIPGHLVEQTGRFAHFALAAAKEAVDDAGLVMEEEDPFKVGILIGTGRGGVSDIEEMYRSWQDGREDFHGSSHFAKYSPGSAVSAISIMLGARGPGNTVMAACASGTIAIGNAFRILQRGGAGVMIAGGCEAPLAPGLFAGACATRAMSTRNDNPRRASRPFDRDRDGYVMGEGAGVVVLETLDHALGRGAGIYGEITGYGINSDAYHITSPLPDGAGLARAMGDALREAGLGPPDIDYLNAHGTSTVLNDRCETTAIKKVFGSSAYNLAVSSTKSMTGHLLGAAGAVEFVACLLAMERNRIPPTINYEKPDPECDLDYVPSRARKKELNVTMSNSSGFGGHNACLIISGKGTHLLSKERGHTFFEGMSPTNKWRGDSLLKGLFITGTDTGVGKTVVTGGLAGVLRKNGIKAAAFKPVQTGGIESEGEMLSEDALFYRSAAGLPYSSRELNPICLGPALSPNVAARISGQVIDPRVLAEAYDRLAAENDLVLVEGAGGICVPLVETHFTMADLARLLNIPLLVVAKPGLGTINHTVLTVRYAQYSGIEVKGIIINGYREEQATMAERTNPAVIESMTGVPILGIVPHMPGVSVESGCAGNLVEVLEEKVDWRRLTQAGEKL